MGQSTAPRPLSIRELQDGPQAAEMAEIRAGTAQHLPSKLGGAG